MTPRITIGIPTYNGAERLDWLLKSISLRTPLLSSGAVRIVIVDDGSPRVAETRAVVARWDRELPITFIEHGSNRGISAGWNTCSRAVDAEIVVLANDDVIMPSGGWLESFVHALQHSPGVGVVGANWHAFLAEDVQQLLAGPESDLNVTPRDPGTKAHAPERRPQYEDTSPGRVMCPTGQLFAFRRPDFDAVGGFEERMKSFYEESSFGSEMAARGLIGMQITWPTNWHMWSATFAANPELDANARLAASRGIYRERWGVPDGVPEFDYVNAKYFHVIPDVAVEFLRKGGVVGRGVLRQNGAFVAAEE
jgi:GT2 family glycosyltransferase